MKKATKIILVLCMTLTLMLVAACGSSQNAGISTTSDDKTVNASKSSIATVTAQLVKAVKQNDIARVNQLIAEKGDVNATDESGNSLVIVASAEGYTEVLKALLAAGADVNAVDSGMKATALHAAAYRGFPQVMEVLIKYGVNINAVGPRNGYTALHDAVWQNNVEGVRVLVANGARRDILGKDGNTPLDLAKKNMNEDIIAILESK